ncbi:MAG TPA: hypothetical protein VNM41_04690 [Solirubrobacterales bacterium]|nr:hypothetical protein [Solirubrobacterales bacterium]
MNKALLAALAALAVVAALVAGCGGGDDTTTDETATLTKAEFIKQGDAICEKGNEELEGEFQSFAKENDIPLEKEPNTEQSEELVEEVLVPNIQNQAEELRALGVPSGDEDQVNAMLDSLEEGIEEAEDDPGDLFSGKTDPFGKANKLASEYGLKVCGQE